MTTRTDDLGHPYDGPAVARRVVSLVPSLTETLAGVRREAVVGATDWCTHPADLDRTLEARVRGTKNPDLAAIRALEPDVVVANKEENRELDVRRLREAGVPVWVTDVETVPQALDSIERLLAEALGWPVPAWVEQAREQWCGPLPPVRGRAAVAIWRDPWFVVGPRTFTGDLMRRLGWGNAFDDPGEDADRYPKVELGDVDRAGSDDGDGVDLVVLPDEPYVFNADDGPEAFTQVPTALVEGRLLTWYGPSLADAHEALTTALTGGR